MDVLKFAAGLAAALDLDAPRWRVLRYSDGHSERVSTWTRERAEQVARAHPKARVIPHKGRFAVEVWEE